MALLTRCFCCSLVIGAGFLAVCLLITYLLGFAFELLWILESSSGLPAAAVLLCAGYFTMALFAALLIHGLATKTSICLIGWLFAVSILTFPEAGLVIYMSIQYWRLETLYGITELVCWFIRIFICVVQFVIVQSLYSTWKDEEMVVQRLRELHMASLPPLPVEAINHLNNTFYQNQGFAHSVENLCMSEMKSPSPTSQLWVNPIVHQIPNNFSSLYGYGGYQLYNTQSEFNASIFYPNVCNGEVTKKKSRSLTDVRILDDIPEVNEEKSQHESDISETKPARILPKYNMTVGRINMKPRNSIIMSKYASVDDINENRPSNNHIIKNKTGFYAQPMENYGVPIYYGPLNGPDFLIYKKQLEKEKSTDNPANNTCTDDKQKCKDTVP